jgi:hypothetical protein
MKLDYAILFEDAIRFESDKIKEKVKSFSRNLMDLLINQMSLIIAKMKTS